MHRFSVQRTCSVDKVAALLLFQTLDGEVYERMQEYFTLFCQSELQSCGITQECFMKILSDATKVRIQSLADMRDIVVIEKLLLVSLFTL